MIKYIIDKGVDLECKTNDGLRPIHLICHYSNPEMIKYIVDKGVNLKCKTNKGYKPSFVIECRNFNETQKKFIGLKKINILNLIVYYEWKSA